MTPTLARILDANANRAREALRVAEDYARFGLDDDELSHRLKRLRHDLAGAIAPFHDVAIASRDTAGDVGTDNKTAGELGRADMAAVVIAAGKRLGEALRALGEFSKIDHPDAAAAIEGLRYRWYDLEAAVLRTLRPRGRMAEVRLCVLITESACKSPWRTVAGEALAGGADCLQLREKTLEGGELLRRARELGEMCRRHGAVFIVNDRPDIAVLADADGVHVGQGDLPATEVRKIIGPGKLIGVSTHNMEQARRAVRDGADYIGVGPMFRSPTKPRDFVAGADYAREVVEAIALPALAIAGITEANAGEVLATGLRAIAVTAAVTAADDPRGAAERLGERLRAVD